MTKQKFKNCLVEAMEDKDWWEPDETINEFLRLNYDEDSSLADWDYSDFKYLVSIILKEQNFWEAVRQLDLHTPKEYEDED